MKIIYKLTITELFKNDENDAEYSVILNKYFDSLDLIESFISTLTNVPVKAKKHSSNPDIPELFDLSIASGIIDNVKDNIEMYSEYYDIILNNTEFHKFEIVIEQFDLITHE